jgi:hypothetical protein
VREASSPTRAFLHLQICGSWLVRYPDTYILIGMEAVAESSPRSSTLSPPPLEAGAAATRTVQRFDLARTLAAARAPARETALALGAPVAAGKTGKMAAAKIVAGMTAKMVAVKVAAGTTAKMVVFDRVRRKAPVSSQPAALSFVWSLAASLSLLAVATVATYLLLFPRL